MSFRYLLESVLFLFVWHFKHCELGYKKHKLEIQIFSKRQLTDTEYSADQLFLDVHKHFKLLLFPSAINKQKYHANRDLWENVSDACSHYTHLITDFYYSFILVNSNLGYYATPITMGMGLKRTRNTSLFSFFSHLVQWSVELQYPKPIWVVTPDKKLIITSMSICVWTQTQSIPAPSPSNLL